MQRALACRNLLRSWLDRHAAPDALGWLDAAAAGIAEGAPDREVYISVSLVSRKLGKTDLDISAEDMAQAEVARSGWRPDDWSVDQAARLVLVLGIEDPERMAALIEQLCVTADVAELISFYRGLPLFPRPELYLNRAREGARTNMKAVFNAVAHRNPYPRENFDEAAWNQMILKALFIGAPLWPIQGLDERANPALARMLCDYAHERWAAKRPVTPELWRCVGRYADERAIADLQRVMETGTEHEREAAVLALSDSSSPAAARVLATAGDLTHRIADGRLAWRDVHPE